MALALFNTLEYVKLLTQVGFSQQQAEALNEAQMIATQAILSQVATQSDLKDIRGEIQAFRSEMRGEMQACEHRLEKKIAAIKPFVFKTMISIMLANLTIIGLGIGVLAFDPYLSPSL